MSGNGVTSLLTMTLAAKLGSIAVHADELTGPAGHTFDATEIRKLLDDPEVKDWLAKMDAVSLLPKKRS